MPAQSFEKYVGGIMVSVEAEEGAFPKNTVMSVTPVNGNMLKTAVADAVKGEIYEVQAVDIKFFDLEGKEIEPEIPIRVSIVPGLSQYEGKNTKVVHIDKTGAAEVIEKAAGAETENDRQIVFNADSFSIYSVVFTDEEETDVHPGEETDDQANDQTIEVKENEVPLVSPEEVKPVSPVKTDVAGAAAADRDSGTEGRAEFAAAGAF